MANKTSPKALGLVIFSLVFLSGCGASIVMDDPTATSTLETSSLTAEPTPTSTLTETAVTPPTEQPTVTPRPTPFPGTFIQLTLPDGSVKNIVVNPKLGDIGRLIEINQREGATGLSVEVPTGWGVALPDLFPENWNAYLVPDAGQQPCPADWPTRYRTASMQSAIDGGTAIVFAEKKGSRKLLPLTGVQLFPILGEELRTTEPLYDGPLNASIQIFLVPQGATGRVTLYTGHNFSGSKCTLVFD